MAGGMIITFFFLSFSFFSNYQALALLLFFLVYFGRIIHGGLKLVGMWDLSSGWRSFFVASKFIYSRLS